MKQKQILIYTGILSLAVVGLVFLQSFSCKSVGDEITIRTNYMMYSCGECYPQHKVKEIIDPKGEYDFLLDTDIHIKYASEEQEESIGKQTEKCVICYEFYFTGELKHSKKKGYIFKAKTAKAELRDDKCCD